MGIRIQLASNFQVVELTYDTLDDVKTGDIKQATDLVNQLGKEVINDIKTSNNKPAEEKATKKQVDLLVGKYGCLRQDMVKLTKKEAWKLINDLRDAEEGI